MGSEMCIRDSIMDLAQAIAPGCQTHVVGIRQGEKLHEVMVPEDDARSTIEYRDYFTILPSHADLAGRVVDIRGETGKPCPEGYRYSSETNTEWLTVEQLRDMVGLS